MTLQDEQLFDIPVYTKLGRDQLNALYPPQLKLLHVGVVHRHGERTPIRNYIPSLIPDSAWTLCHVHSAFTASLSAFQTEIDHHESVGENSKTLTKHKPYHPGHETADKPLNGNESTIIQMESQTRFISSEALSSVGPISRRIEEAGVTKAQLHPPLKGQCFYGQLTDRGRETLFQLGKSLRDLYVKSLGFLPDSFDLQKTGGMFYFRTTDYPRTLESIQNLLGGIYPMSKRTGQPPVVHTRFNHEETLIASGSCKKYRKLVHEFKDAYKHSHHEQIEEMKRKHKDIMENDPAKPNLHALYDTFIAQRAHGMELPRGVGDQELFNLENHAQMLWFEVYRKNQEATRLAIGRFLEEYRAKLLQIISGKGEFKDVKLSIYSGHDSTIAPLLGAFHVGNGRWPPFASNLVIELFQDDVDKEKYVRMKYNSEVVPIPACAKTGKGHRQFKNFCTVEAFLEIVEQHIPKNYQQECRE